MMKALDDSVAAAYDGARKGGDGQTGRFARRARSRRHRTGGGTRQYDAFGRTVRQTGPYAEANPFRYSTKYTDDGTSLIYYGKRYYHSAWGRFITRDPAQESGGLNLYGFTGNNGVNRIDYLGLSAIEDGHTMDPYGTECTREEVDMGDRVMVTTDCNDGSAPFTEFFNKQNPGGGDMFGGDGGFTIDTGGLPGVVVTPNTGGDSTVVVEEENPSNPEPWTEAECEGLAALITAQQSALDVFRRRNGGSYVNNPGLAGQNAAVEFASLYGGSASDYIAQGVGWAGVASIVAEVGARKFGGVRAVQAGSTILSGVSHPTNLSLAGYDLKHGSGTGAAGNFAGAAGDITAVVLTGAKAAPVYGWILAGGSAAIFISEQTAMGIQKAGAAREIATHYSNLAGIEVGAIGRIKANSQLFQTECGR